MTKHIPIEKAAERYLAGEGSGAIASEYGLTVCTLRRKLIAHGVTMRPRGGRESLTAAQAEALVRDFKAGDKQGGTLPGLWRVKADRVPYPARRRRQAT